jgi:hypothetical protein
MLSMSARYKRGVRLEPCYDRSPHLQHRHRPIQLHFSLQVVKPLLTNGLNTPGH